MPCEHLWYGHQAPATTALHSLLRRPAGSLEWSLPAIPTLHTDLRTCHSSVHPHYPVQHQQAVEEPPCLTFSSHVLEAGCGARWHGAGKGWPPEGAWGAHGENQEGWVLVSLGPVTPPTWPCPPSTQPSGEGPRPNPLSSHTPPSPAAGSLGRIATPCLCGSLPSFLLVHPGGRGLTSAVGCCVLAGRWLGGAVGKLSTPAHSLRGQRRGGHRGEETQ